MLLVQQYHNFIGDGIKYIDKPKSYVPINSNQVVKNFFEYKKLQKND